MDCLEGLRESEQCREVYAHYGAAMYFAQVVETGLVNVLTLVECAARRESGATNADAAERYAGMLIRDLVRALQDRGNAPSSLVDSLHRFRQDRNYLTHRFFYERITDFYTTEGRQAMVDDLAAMTDRFRELEQQLQQILLWLGHRFGLTAERLDDVMADMVDGRMI